MMATRTRVLLGILALTLIASISLSAEKAFDRRFNVAPGGHLRLDTGIRLKNIDASVKASTSGGSVHAEIRSNHGISLSTSGGTISLLLPENARASIDAWTSGGRVSSAIPLSNTETADPTHLRGAINGGGERVELHTSGGSIHLDPLT